MDDQGYKGLISLIVIALYVLVFVIPIAKVLRRVGFSGWGSILAVVPLLGIIGLWIFAFMRWPLDDKPRAIASERY